MDGFQVSAEPAADTPPAPRTSSQPGPRDRTQQKQNNKPNTFLKQIFVFDTFFLSYVAMDILNIAILFKVTVLLGFMDKNIKLLKFYITCMQKMAI